MPNPAWIKQQLDKMAPGIRAGKTRKRNVESVIRQKSNEDELSEAVAARGWKLAQIGNDFVVTPPDYIIRPI